jgi:hypothetical protein
VVSFTCPDSWVRSQTQGFFRFFLMGGMVVHPIPPVWIILDTSYMDPQHEQIQCTKLGFKKGERDSHQSITNHLPFNSSFFPLKDELSPIHRRSSYGSGSHTGRPKWPKCCWRGAWMCSLEPSFWRCGALWKMWGIDPTPFMASLRCLNGVGIKKHIFRDQKKHF